MHCKFRHVWTTIAAIAYIMKSVNVQFAMPGCLPMYPGPPPPIFPMQAAMPIIGQALCPKQIPEDMLSSETKTTTTTKQPDNIAVAVPIPVPMPVPVGVPVFASSNFCQRPPPRPKNCPPCPPCVCSPSCTPSFFSYCSSCHMKCRCRNRENATEPPQPQPAAYGMPIPIPAMAPPVIVVPYPPPIPIPIRQNINRPKKNRRPRYSSCSTDSAESSSSSESEYVTKRRNKKRKWYSGYRRSLRSLESENELVKPMLSYVADNGDIKFKAKISGDDVAELLREKKTPDKQYETVHVVPSEDNNDRPKIVVFSNKGGNRKQERYKKVVLRGGVANHVLGDGKKELVFKPPGNKKISNLSVSFQIS